MFCYSRRQLRKSCKAYEYKKRQPFGPHARQRTFLIFFLQELDSGLSLCYNHFGIKGKVMRKIFIICLLFAIGICFVGCAEPKQFEISLKEGLFQGISDFDSELTVSVELSEMDQVEYIKTHKNKVKDLSTIDTKFYKAYHINFVLSEGNENYVVEFSEAVAQDIDTTDTYKLKGIGGDMFDRKLDLSDVTLQPIDNDGDKTTDELKIDYKLNGAPDSADLKFISEGTESPNPHHNFQYHCNLTFDENIKFEAKDDDAFWAGTELHYSIYKIEGYKIVMYVDEKPYTEIDPSGIEVMRFGYVTGYRDVSIEFQAVKNE